MLAKLDQLRQKIAEDTVNNGAQVELGAKGVKHHSMVIVMGSKGSLVKLEHMGMFWRFHHGVNNGVELEGHLVDLNWLKRPRDKHIVCLWSSGTAHNNKRWRWAYHTKR